MMMSMSSGKTYWTGMSWSDVEQVNKRNHINNAMHVYSVTRNLCNYWASIQIYKLWHLNPMVNANLKLGCNGDFSVPSPFM